MADTIEELIAINLELVSLLMNANTGYGYHDHFHTTFDGCDAKNLGKIYDELEKLEYNCQKEKLLRDRAKYPGNVGLTLTKGMTQKDIEKTIRNKLTEVRSELGLT